MNTIKSLQKRTAVIRSELTRMSHNGWRDAKASEYQPLEAELRQLEELLAAKLQLSRALRGLPS